VIHPGDRLVLESGGGGGWGDPAQRDLAAIATDVENGFVTNGADKPLSRTAGEGGAQRDALGG
jgi:N-methylhydantoinase B